MSTANKWLRLALLFILGSAARNHEASASPAVHNVPQGMPPSSSVVELNLWTFRGSVGDGRLWLVEFYVPWCRGCKRMAGEYDKLAESLMSARDVVVARFDCMQDEEMCERLGVDRTPTLKLFLNGQVVETYKAEVYHTDLLGPFMRRMREKYIASSPAAAPPDALAGGGAAATREGTAAPGPPSGEAAAAAPGPTGVGDAGETAGGGGDGGGGKQQQQQQQQSDAVIQATPVQPGVYDKPAEATLPTPGYDTGVTGGGSAAPGGGALAEEPLDAPRGAAVDEGREVVTTVAAAERRDASGDSSAGGTFGEPPARRGRHGGLAAETLQREKEEL